jgi:hypothetical protein
MKKFFFDVLHTRDGYDIYWLYCRTPKDYKRINGTWCPTTDIDPDDLYYNEYSFYEECEEVVMSGAYYENYAVPEELLEEWENNLKTKLNN